MALTLNSHFDWKEGIIRCVVSREGDVEKRGYVDRSALYKVVKNDAGIYEITCELYMKNTEEIINSLNKKGLDFIGFEDPDIWADETNNTLHVYFTIPLFNKRTGNAVVHLGHAFGTDLSDLTMTQPVLMEKNNCGAKEVSIAPMNKRGFRYNLVESSDHGKGYWYSTIRTVIAEDMGKNWKFGKTVFHPKKENIEWAGGHASPGPLMSRKFIDVGEGKCLGFMNGREVDRKNGTFVKYGKFSVGLFIYNYEEGKIEWISPNYFIRDSQAKTITFASYFMDQQNGKGLLYAHVDDSFVRSYEITVEGLKKFMENK
ncbi:MAG: hypothetical protein WC819_03055 [Parcubacteria group bacterium]